MYPALPQERKELLMGMPEPERRQALVLLGAAYRNVQTQVLRDGLCSLAILVCLGRLEEHNETVEIDVLLESLLVALIKNRDVEGAIYSAANHSRRTDARHHRKSQAAKVVLPKTATMKPMLTLPQALAKLNPRYQRVALMLAEGRKTPEIMEVFELSEAAAWQLICRVRAALQKIIA